MANKEIKLGGYVVNESSFPYIIAEIGINHNGDIQIAKKLIDAANACLWDCVKFQKREPDIAVPEEGLHIWNIRKRLNLAKRSMTT